MKNQDRFDQLLQIACQEYVEKTESELKTEEELRQAGIEPHAFSPQFEKKMEKLIRRQRRAAWRARHKRGLQRLAASVALFIAVSGITIANVDAFRIPVMSFLLNLTEDHSEIKVNNDNPSISDTFDPYLPTYMPDGYDISSVKEYTNEGIDIQYVNDQGDYFWLEFNFQMSDASVDTEDAKIEQIAIQNEPALVTEKENRIMVIWGAKGRIYTLTGYLPKDEAVKMLESVKLK